MSQSCHRTRSWMCGKIGTRSVGGDAMPKLKWLSVVVLSVALSGAAYAAGRGAAVGEVATAGRRRACWRWWRTLWRWRSFWRWGHFGGGAHFGGGISAGGLPRWRRPVCRRRRGISAAGRPFRMRRRQVGGVLARGRGSSFRGNRAARSITAGGNTAGHESKRAASARPRGAPCAGRGRSRRAA